MSRRKATVYATRIGYLNPKDCDSTLGYSITGRRHFNANMSLSDCNRKIVWYFDNDADSLQKIDNILETMMAFKADFLAAQKKYRKRARRRRVNEDT